MFASRMFSSSVFSLCARAAPEQKQTTQRWCGGGGNGWLWLMRSYYKSMRKWRAGDERWFMKICDKRWLGLKAIGSGKGAVKILVFVCGAGDAWDVLVAVMVESSVAPCLELVPKFAPWCGEESALTCSRAWWSEENRITGLRTASKAVQICWAVQSRSNRIPSCA